MPLRVEVLRAEVGAQLGTAHIRGPARRREPPPCSRKWHALRFEIISRAENSSRHLSLFFRAESPTQQLRARAARLLPDRHLEAALGESIRAERAREASARDEHPNRRSNRRPHRSARPFAALFARERRLTAGARTGRSQERGSDQLGAAFRGAAAALERRAVLREVVAAPVSRLSPSCFEESLLSE